MSATGRGLVPPGLPAWFGKLPGMGDFASRRLPERSLGAWDAWLQRGLAGLRERHPDWIGHYLRGPLWFFLLAGHVLGERPWLGVLMPSVDGVGRYFPLTVLAELDEPPASLEGGCGVQALQWWRLGARAALTGLEHDLDATRFEALLDELFSAPAAAVSQDEGAGTSFPTPGPGASLWLRDLGRARGMPMTVIGLPEDGQFDALFELDSVPPVIPGHDATAP